MNGMGGLHALSPDGERLWRYSKIVNVRNQAIVPAIAHSPALIFATESGAGTIQVLDARGTLIRTFSPRSESFCSLSAARVNTDGSVQCMVMDRITLALNLSGQVLWSAPAHKDHPSWRANAFAFGDIDQDGSTDWAFADDSGTLIIVSAQGEKFAQLDAPKDPHAFTITPNPGGKDILVVLKDDTLKAFNFE